MANATESDATVGVLKSGRSGVDELEMEIGAVLRSRLRVNT